MNFNHIPILLEECIENLNIKPDGIYVDGTLGGAGHGKEIAKRLNKSGHFIGIDQDENAIKVAKERLKNLEPKISIIRDNFKNIKNILDVLHIEKIDGILLDLGVSSHQLDQYQRGFSYQHDAPLDMRMDNRQLFTAKDIVNNYSKTELIRVIKGYGEEKWASRIAQFIINYRDDKEIATTVELSDIIKNAIPAKARRQGPHPAKRTFQALRIEINNELNIIEDAIEDIVELLKSNGRACIISFHSLEDRIVKKTFKRLEDPCTCPRDFPQCVCGNKPKIKIISRKPIVPNEEEIARNSRSRSAKLRVAERCSSNFKRGE